MNPSKSILEGGHRPIRKKREGFSLEFEGKTRAGRIGEIIRRSKTQSAKPKAVRRKSLSGFEHPPIKNRVTQSPKGKPFNASSSSPGARFLGKPLRSSAALDWKGDLWPAGAPGLALLQPIQLNPGPTETEIIGWGMRVPNSMVHPLRLRRALARRFLALDAKASRQLLNQAESEVFETISQQVDYRAFHAARAMPRFHRATLRRSGAGVSLELTSGRTVVLPLHLAGQVEIIEDGERFGAWFRWDRFRRITAIERIELLPPSEAVDLTGDPHPEFSQEVLSLFPKN